MCVSHRDLPDLPGSRCGIAGSARCGAGDYLALGHVGLRRATSRGCSLGGTANDEPDCIPIDVRSEAAVVTTVVDKIVSEFLGREGVGP